jgi:hypothetical protein
LGSAPKSVGVTLPGLDAHAPSREIRHLKIRLRDIAEGTLSGAVDPRWATVAVQAYNALIRALEQGRKTVEQEEIMERLERLEARRGMVS